MGCSCRVISRATSWTMSRTRCKAHFGSGPQEVLSIPCSRRYKGPPCLIHSACPFPWTTNVRMRSEYQLCSNAGLSAGQYPKGHAVPLVRADVMRKPLFNWCLVRISDVTLCDFHPPSRLHTLFILSIARLKFISPCPLLQLAPYQLNQKFIVRQKSLPWDNKSE